MSSATQPSQFDDLSGARRAAGTWAVGFAYWLAFLLVLEPGNVSRAMGGLSLSHEMARIAAAALMGSSVTPLILASVRRFPVEGPSVWRNAGIQLAVSLALGAGLMVISCFVAELMFGQQRPFVSALRREFENNWLLVSFCIATFAGFCHTQLAQNLFGLRLVRGAVALPASTYLSELPAKLRNELIYVQLAQVDWIEAQGNYLALHQGADTHLVRESLASIVEKLDPQQFVRVHRGAIVSLTSIEGLSPLGSGDARLRLRQGTELRLSRKYRAAFMQAWRR
jgi:hypothetical protein